MSSAIGPYGRDQMLRAFFDPGWSRPDQVWIALCAEVPIAGADGSQLSEPLTGGYLRVGMPVDALSWEFTGYGDVFNSVAAQWDVATEDWGLLAGWALLDSDTSGQAYGIGSLVVPQMVLAGMAPYLDPGTIVWSLTD